MILTLLDGEHEIGKPSLYVLELMADYGVDIFAPETLKRFEEPKEIFRLAPALLAAFLTASEPLGPDYEPERVWTPQEVKRLIPLDEVSTLGEVLIALVDGSLPDADQADTTRPTNGRARAPKQ
jgi:hypothetical protein